MSRTPPPTTSKTFIQEGLHLWGPVSSSWQLGKLRQCGPEPARAHTVAHGGARAPASSLPVCVCRLVVSDSLVTSLPGPSVHGILQARIPEWVAVSFSRGSSRLRDQTQVSCTAGRCFTTEPPEASLMLINCQAPRFALDWSYFLRPKCGERSLAVLGTWKLRFWDAM